MLWMTVRKPTFLRPVFKNLGILPRCEVSEVRTVFLCEQKAKRVIFRLVKSNIHLLVKTHWQVLAKNKRRWLPLQLFCRHEATFEFSVTIYYVLKNKQTNRTADTDKINILYFCYFSVEFSRYLLALVSLTALKLSSLSFFLCEEGSRPLIHIKCEYR